MNPSLGQHQKWTIILISLATLVGCIYGQTGYRCYTCVSQENDLTCLNNPNQVIVGSPWTECDQEDGSGFGWCTIRRVEYTDMPGTIASFVRGCEKKEPPIQDDIRIDNQFTVFYRTCRSHLCNTGDGVDSLDTSNDVVSGPGSNRRPIIVLAENAALSSSIPPVQILALALGLLTVLIHFP
jgi:hypothetical protein